MTLTPPRMASISLGLEREIVPANYIAVAVERRLAGDEDDAARVTSTVCEQPGSAPGSGGLMRMIEGIVSRVMPIVSPQLRGTETAGGARPTCFGFRVPT